MKYLSASGASDEQRGPPVADDFYVSGELHETIFQLSIRTFERPINVVCLSLTFRIEINISGK